MNLRIGTAAMIAAMTAALLAGCAAGVATPAPTEAGALTGTVTYRERMALPAEAIVELRLLEVTRADAPTLVARTSFTADGRQPPLPFELRVDPARLERHRAYALRAAILAGGRPRFASDRPVPVLPRGAPSRVDLLLVGAPAAAEVADLRGTTWRLDDLAGAGPAGRVDATLQFDADGRVSGHGGCNRFTGTATIRGQSIAFSPLATTKMACVQEIAGYESRYLSALGQAEWFEVEAQSLAIFARGVELPLRFARTRR